MKSVTLSDERLEDQCIIGDSARPFVSVIIPTYRDWSKVLGCLKALSVQRYPQDKFEVIVVNNDSDETCPFSDLPGTNVRVVEERRPGSYAARNTGIGLAKGEIVAFTDSDCEPDSCWIASAVDEIIGGADRVAGAIELIYQSSTLTLAEAYERIFAFKQEQNVNLLGAGVTANLIVRRELFEQVGLFNASMMSGGDLEWGQRATRLGINLIYSKSAIVRHPARVTLKELMVKSRRVASGSVQMERLSGGVRIATILRGFIPPIKALPVLRSTNDINLLDKTSLFFIVYFLKLHSVFHRLLIISKVSMPRRV